MQSENANEEYLRLQHLGLKEKKKLEAAGRSPYPAVLEELLPNLSGCSVIELPVQDVPVDRIAGTVSKGRMNAFSASFYPLLEPESEFAAKWTALFRAHLSDVGITEPVECLEFFGSFYIREGNKRVSVLKDFGALRIPAKIFRVIPPDQSDPRAAAYKEFVEFHRATGIYDLQFRKEGDFAKLCAALGKKPGEKWEESEIRRFAASFHQFKEAFLQIDEGKSALLPEDALLLFFRVYTCDQLYAMSQGEMKKALQSLWGDVQASSEPAAITVRTVPEEKEKLGVIGKLISGVPMHPKAAFIYQQDEEISPWTAGHAAGARDLEEALRGSVTVKNYFHADSPEEAEKLLDLAAEEGADVIFTTTPPLLSQTLKAALRHPKVRFFNCSACQPLSSVRSYYCRTYEGKFITGAIAGALAENDLVGYVGSYPILGVPASINAFALGVRMTNPRAKVLLAWSCTDGDPVAELREKGARVISNRDMPLPDADYMKDGGYGTFTYDAEGKPLPLASPCWMWGTLYEKIMRSVMGGNEKKEQSEAVNYWWGMDSGVIDVKLTENVPEGVRALARLLGDRLRAGEYDIFSQELYAQDGTLLCGHEPLPSIEILRMDKLAETVTGRIPTFAELLPRSRVLVKELGGHLVKLPPEGEEEA